VYNLKHNPDISLNDGERRLFQKHKRTLDILINPSIPVSHKRKYLTNSQTGGVFPILGALIPTLLKTGIGLLGSSIFGNILNKITGNQE
jgi:hypothetical protein